MSVRCGAKTTASAAVQLVLLMLTAMAPSWAAPTPPALVGSSEKVCQVDGNVDWETGAPTAAQTLTNFGLDAADLGYPVEYGNALVLLFGDSWPSNPSGVAGELGANDAVGVTTRAALPTSSACLDLSVNRYLFPPKRFFPATIVPQNVIKQGWFNVPSGGVSVSGALVGFFWTNHCATPHALLPSPAFPLARPVGTPSCPEVNGRNSVGWNVMARSTDYGRTFHDVVVMPSGFTYATGVNAETLFGLPAGQRLGVYVLGSPRYRASTPYLAYAPPGMLAQPTAWRYFTGRDPAGNPHWASFGAWQHGTAPIFWSPPGDAEILSPVTNAQRCIGEFSVTWIAPLHRWLMLYNCDFVIMARTAFAIWGPWSAATPILGYGPAVECHIVMATTGCGTRRNYWPKLANGLFVPGLFYAPFVIERYTRPTGADGVTIYWLVSTWNPYEVDVMRTTLQL